MQSDAGAHPGLVDIEIDAHHFALTHPEEIVHERGIAILIRPHKHQPDLGLRFVTIDSRNKRRVIDFLLEDPVMRIFQCGNFFPRWFHVHSVTGE